MNEKELNDLILKGIRNGEVPLEVSDSVADHWLSTGTEISDAVRLRIKSNLKQRMQNTAIQQALSSAGKEVLPFGRFIESIRERAGLSRSDVAERLKKNDEYVQRVERGDVVPTQLRAPEFADLVELFQITVVRRSRCSRLDLTRWTTGIRFVPRRGHVLAPKRPARRGC